MFSISDVFVFDFANSGSLGVYLRLVFMIVYVSMVKTWQNSSVFVYDVSAYHTHHPPR